jgi:hypothetical protein
MTARNVRNSKQGIAGTPGIPSRTSGYSIDTAARLAYNHGNLEAPRIDLADVSDRKVVREGVVLRAVLRQLAGEIAEDAPALYVACRRDQAVQYFAYWSVFDVLPTDVRIAIERGWMEVALRILELARQAGERAESQ